MPAKSRHMQRRKERIADAKKNARLARKIRHRRQWQAGGGLLAIAAVVTALFLWQTGVFDRAEDPMEDEPTTITDQELDLDELLDEEQDEAGDSADEEESDDNADDSSNEDEGTDG